MNDIAKRATYESVANDLAEVTLVDMRELTPKIESALQNALTVQRLGGRIVLSPLWRSLLEHTSAANLRGVEDDTTTTARGDHRQEQNDGSAANSNRTDSSPRVSSTPALIQEVFRNDPQTVYSPVAVLEALEGLGWSTRSPSPQAIVANALVKVNKNYPDVVAKVGHGKYQFAPAYAASRTPELPVNTTGEKHGQVSRAVQFASNEANTINYKESDDEPPRTPL